MNTRTGRQGLHPIRVLSLIFFIFYTPKPQICYEHPHRQTGSAPNPGVVAAFFIFFTPKPQIRYEHIHRFKVSHIFIA
jgi:hypothetical protein